MKNKIYIASLTIIFTFFIFFIKNVFFASNEISLIEESFIDESKEIESILTNDSKIDYSGIKEAIFEINKDEKEFKSASKVLYSYIPDSFEKDVLIHKNTLSTILNNSIFNSKIIAIGVQFYKQKIDVRGKMKGGVIKLFGPDKLKSPELISLFIHEFSHYIDIYFLEKTLLIDPSYNFYNISWDGTKVLKGGQTTLDFVSGYAMTNKYEDFAESFTYYILHNKDFLDKAEKSEYMKRKYSFFSKVLFSGKIFKNTDFSIGNKVLDYYWDVTKIDISSDNFLQYLEK